MRTTSILRWLAVLVAVVCASALTGTSVAAPGNDGVIKLDDVPFDSAPDNEPHVGCEFELDFYGYDQGTNNNFNAKVKFVVQPPTGKDIILLQDTIFIGEDPAGGGTDLDAHRVYNLSGTLEEFMAHPQQGYHVKVTVKAPGSIGADTKYKTFWVRFCGGY